jgi:D-tyrosyl-tRNA(Tyr) deacylase
VRCVLQRVARARVDVDGACVGAIGRGLLVLAGVAPGDTPDDVAWMAEKIATLRIFPDEAGRMDRSVRDIGGGILVVSQFTLLGDAARGRRPGFSGAAHPDVARPLVDLLVARLGAESGRFGADMAVELVNDGPVTLILESPRRGGDTPPRNAPPPGVGGGA